MSSTKEIRTHMESVRETQKITNAMYLIASTKLRRARADLSQTKPYFEALKIGIRRMLSTVTDADSRYFAPSDKPTVLEDRSGCLIITADKGLAGAYNQNVIRAAEELRQKHPACKLFVVGEYGRHYFEQHHIPAEKSFLYTAQNPTMERAREISTHLLELYDSGDLNEIFLIYTDMESSLVSKAVVTRLLPFHRMHFEAPCKERNVDAPFEFVPSVGAVLDHMMQSYISGYLYSALIDSYCSEQNARMTAMDSANHNAEKLLDELSLQYNRVRQAAITREITEISVGARAQRGKTGKDV